MWRFVLLGITFFSTAFCGLREDLIDDVSIWIIRLESGIEFADNRDYAQGKIDALLIVLDHLSKNESPGKNNF